MKTNSCAKKNIRECSTKKIIVVQICLRLQSVNAHLPIGEYVNVQLKCLEYANQKDGKIRL